jgi:hypothetical protein
LEINMYYKAYFAANNGSTSGTYGPYTNKRGGAKRSLPFVAVISPRAKLVFGRFGMMAMGLSTGKLFIRER